MCCIATYLDIRIFKLKITCIRDKSAYLFLPWTMNERYEDIFEKTFQQPELGRFRTKVQGASIVLSQNCESDRLKTAILVPGMYEHLRVW